MALKQYYASIKKPLAQFFNVSVPKSTPLMLRLYPWILFLCASLYIFYIIDFGFKKIAKKILRRRPKIRKILNGNVEINNFGIDKCMCKQEDRPIKDYPVTPVYIRNGKKCRIGGICGNIGGEYISCDIPQCGKWYDFSGEKENITPKN